MKIGALLVIYPGARVGLEQAEDLARRVEVNLPESGAGAQAGHGLHVAKNGIQEACTCRQPDSPDGDGESCERTRISFSGKSWHRYERPTRCNILQLRVVRE